MQSMNSNKQNMKSNKAWHRPKSASSRVEDELIEKSTRALASTTDPLKRLRLLCLSRGASGILGLGRVFRRVDEDGNKQLNKEQFIKGIKETGLDFDDESAEQLFKTFDVNNSGYVDLDKLMLQIRPPMSECRRAIVEQAFRKLDRAGHGVITVDDFKRVYSVNSDPRYMSGEDSAEEVMKKFLVHFDTDGTVDGTLTLEDFMNYNSGLSVSIDNDCNFDLMMRQTYKL